MTIFIVSVLVIFLSLTYAFVSHTLVGTKRQVITSTDLSVELNEEEHIVIEDALPMYDETGKIQEKIFAFQIINKSNYKVDYSLYLKDITESEKEKLDYEDVKYYLTKESTEQEPKLLSECINNQIDEGSIAKKSIIHYTLRFWIDNQVTDNQKIENKTLKFKIEVQVKKDAKEEYGIHYETGTTLKIADASKIEGEDFTITDIIPVKENHTFLGWSTKENGEVEYRANDVYREDKETILYAIYGIHYLYHEGNEFLNDTGGWGYKREFESNGTSIAADQFKLEDTYIEWSETGTSLGEIGYYGKGSFSHQNFVSLAGAKQIHFQYAVPTATPAIGSDGILYDPSCTFKIYDNLGNIVIENKLDFKEADANYTTATVDVSKVKPNMAQVQITCQTYLTYDIQLVFRLTSIYTSM